MKIAASEVSLFRVAGPVAREAACVVVSSDHVETGVGEAAPIEGFSRETLSTSVGAMRSVLATLDVLDDDLPPADAVAHALAPHTALLETAPSARFALETALFDLLAHARGGDVVSCLRDERDERRERTSSAQGAATSALLAAGAHGVARSALPAAMEGGPQVVETSALLRDPADPAFTERVAAAVARGFRVIKVKLRAEDDAMLEREIEGLRALRRIAPDVELRLDPNGRWSIEDARRRLARLAEVAPSFVEQPVAPADLEGLGRCAVLWAADESLALPGFAERLPDEAGCAAFVLKPAALGLLRARELASLARARGLGVVVTHFFDGPIGLAAACETALSLDAPLLACGLDPHVGLRSLPASALPHHDALSAEEAPSLRPRNSGEGEGARPSPHVHRTGQTGLGLPRDMLPLLAEWMP